MATKSIQRSLKRIKELEWQYWITEKYNPFSKQREDLFNFIDILCLSGDRTIAIQACGTDFQQHVRKIKDNAYIKPWLEAGNECQIWSWRKVKKTRGGKQSIWKPRIADIVLIEDNLHIKERKQK